MPKLTKTILDRAEVREKPYFMWCSELPGFGARVFPSGKRTFYADYYNQDGRRNRMSLGPYGKLTVEEARKLARITLGGVLSGEDPALERRTRRTSMTVSDLCGAYLAAVEKGLVIGKSGRAKKASTLSTDRGRVSRHITPLLGKKLVIDLKASDISRFLRDVTAGKTATVEKTGNLRGKSVVKGGAGTASRTVGLLGGILTYAVSEGIIDTNPARGVKRPADNKMERRLTAKEYRALGKALEAAETEAWQGRAGVWLLALTGARISEIRGLKHTDVDIDGQCIRLGDTKTGASVRPLGESAVDVLKGIERTPGSGYVLPGVRDDQKPYSVIDDVLDRLVAAAGLEDVTAHTLRHSFASVAGDLEYSDSTIGAMIGHVGTTITSRYVHRLDAVLVAAADKVAAEVYRQMTG